MRWKVWAGFYVALVGVTATLNQFSGEQLGWYWYAASVALTLLWSPFAIYPILALAGISSSATGGAWTNSNALGGAAVVASFIALAILNALLVRALRKIRRRSVLSAAG